MWNTKTNKINLCGNGSQNSDYHLGVFTRRKHKRDLVYLEWKFVSQGVTCLFLKFPPCHLAHLNCLQESQIPDAMVQCFMWVKASENLFKVDLGTRDCGVATTDCPVEAMPNYTLSLGKQRQAHGVTRQSNCGSCKDSLLSKQQRLSQQGKQNKIEEAPKLICHTRWPLS